MQAKQPRFESGSDDSFDERLTGLEVFAADRQTLIDCEFGERGYVTCEVRGAVRERNTSLERCIAINHRWRDRRVIFLHGALERFQVRVFFVRLQEYLRGGAPDHNEPLALSRPLEFVNVVNQL